MKLNTMNDDSDDEEYVQTSPMANVFRPPKKRSRVTSCASSAAVPSFVHRRMIAYANSRCWLCSQHRNHIAHVIAFP